MKHLPLTFALLILALTSVLAQTPNAINYQTVVRDVSGSIVASQAVSFQLSILEDNATGTVAYSETQSTTTNALGLVSLAIGNGTVVSGTFAGIDWANHDHYLKVEFDITGGISYLLMGTSQLLSVPYAQHAKTVETDLDEQDLSTNGDTIFISNGTYVVIPGLSLVGSLISPPNVQQRLDDGETPKEIYDSGIPLDSLYGKTYQGGLISYLNTTTGAGLLAAPTDQSTTGIVWWNGSYIVTGASGTAIGTGQANTNSIIAAQGAGSYAATLCDGLTIGIYSDWFLPSKDELNKMYINL